MKNDIALVRPTLALKKEALAYRREHLEHTLNDFLKDLGNCGYSVRPSERKKGYATEMLGQLLKEAKAAEMTELHISVEKDNTASINVIRKNGGVYERSFAFEGNAAAW